MKKVAIVTGGTRGIGRAISLDLARQGYAVKALFARDRESAKDLEETSSKEGLDIVTLKSDLSKKEGVEEVISLIKAQTSSVDVLVHCAASGVHRPAREITTKHLRWTFEINVLAIQQILMDLVPMMSSGSRIIGLTSNGGTRTIPFYTAVGSSKGALDSLFRHWAVELAPSGIAVNLVCPGMVMTDAVEAFPDKEGRIQACIRQTPTGKMTTPEDVGEFVSFLCTSRMASQFVGQTFTIDGGKCILA
ncbi:MAG: SDR family oxidoreductase [Pseudomonadota bacterium]